MVFVLSVLNRVYNFAQVCLNNVHDLCESVPIINRVLGPKQGTKIDGVVINSICILGFFCPKQGQGFKPSVGHLYPNIGQVPHPGWIPLYRFPEYNKQTYPASPSSSSRLYFFFFS